MYYLRIEKLESANTRNSDYKHTLFATQKPPRLNSHSVVGDTFKPSQMIYS